jgi:hypothetical protein
MISKTIEESLIGGQYMMVGVLYLTTSVRGTRRRLDSGNRKT